MLELEAMADYNLARSQNLFGGYQNAFNQRSGKERKVSGHMMPDFVEWLRTARPQIAEHLYGPSAHTRQWYEASGGPVVPRARDRRGVQERRGGEAKTPMPPVDEQGRVRHHHTYEQQQPSGAEQRSYQVKAGALAQRRENMIHPGKPKLGPVAPKEADERLKRLEAAEKRRREGSKNFVGPRK
jgi:hypothetical protein